MMSRWPNVTGSYEPGQTAVPPFRSAGMDRDAGVAVAALDEQREGKLERPALVGFGHDACALWSHRVEALRERPGQTGRRIIWRVAEHEVVRPLGARQEPQRVLPHHPLLEPERRQVPFDDGRRPRVALDEDRRARSA